MYEIHHVGGIHRPVPRIAARKPFAERLLKSTSAL